MPNSDNGVWLECNGQYVDPSLYLDLAKLTTHTPDYRGVFLRGLGAISSTHFGNVSHQSDGLGILQGDSVRNIKGTAYSQSWSEATIYTSGAFRDGGNTGDYASQSYSPTRSHVLVFDASLVVPVANENRPINKAVRYLIKAK